MLINGKNYRTLWSNGNSVCMINQLLLPHKFEIYESKSYLQTADAIKSMVIRGAPAIGAAGAYGMSQAALEFNGNEFSEFAEFLESAEKTLKATRPTAYDLFYAIDAVKKRIISQKSVKDAKNSAMKFADEYADWSSDLCKRIGSHGNKVIKNGFKILTHCNAGALACVDFGTALAPIRMANLENKKIHVFVDETRPRNQGMFLTAWELCQEGINHSIIADNAAGHFMRQGEIDMVIVGADRIAMNGDAANKIGTYTKAVLAKENNIPFYVAAPLSTFDRNAKTGKDIPIEERSSDEVFYVSGINENGDISKIRIAPGKSRARNPAFDVTPAKYITGIITEEGIVRPNNEEIKKFTDHGTILS